MKQIQLTQGKVAIVDDADYEWLSQYSWQAIQCRRKWYAKRTVARPNRAVVYMHREIVKAERGEQVDHRDGDGLNNRRENLRRCSQSENNLNRDAQVNNRSGYKGVRWSADTGKWRAQITVAGNQMHLGLFTTKEQAARAYDDAARTYYGSFARTNFQ